MIEVEEVLVTEVEASYPHLTVVAGNGVNTCKMFTRSLIVSVFRSYLNWPLTKNVLMITLYVKIFFYVCKMAIIFCGLFLINIHFNTFLFSNVSVSFVSVSSFCNNVVYSLSL